MREPWFASPGAFTDLLVILLLILALGICSLAAVFLVASVVHTFIDVAVLGWHFGGLIF